MSSFNSGLPQKTKISWQKERIFDGLLQAKHTKKTVNWDSVEVVEVTLVSNVNWIILIKHTTINILITLFVLMYELYRINLWTNTINSHFNLITTKHYLQYHCLFKISNYQVHLFNLIVILIYFNWSLNVFHFYFIFIGNDMYHHFKDL